MKALMMQDLLENSFEFIIKFKNLTSETTVENPIQMVCCFSNGCSLLVPTKCCVKGHQVLLQFHFLKPVQKKRKDIEVVGKIQEVNAVDDKTIEVSVQFNQYIKDEWYAILGLLDGKQEEISTIVKKLKTI